MKAVTNFFKYIFIFTREDWREFKKIRDFLKKYPEFHTAQLNVSLMCLIAAIPVFGSLISYLIKFSWISLWLVFSLWVIFRYYVNSKFILFEAIGEAYHTGKQAGYSDAQKGFTDTIKPTIH